MYDLLFNLQQAIGLISDKRFDRATSYITSLNDFKK